MQREICYEPVTLIRHYPVANHQEGIDIPRSQCCCQCDDSISPRSALRFRPALLLEQPDQSGLDIQAHYLVDQQMASCPNRLSQSRVENRDSCAWHTSNQVRASRPYSLGFETHHCFPPLVPSFNCLYKNSVPVDAEHLVTLHTT